MSTMIKVPEFILFDVIQGALEYIRADYAAQQDSDRSYLRRVLNGTEFQRYGFAEQAEKVFLADESDPRFLEVDLMFNMNKDTVPSIYIALPSESTQNGGNGMGSDEGYVSEILINSTYDADDHLTEQGRAYPVYTRRYQASYQIIVTSDNSNEVVLIYHTLRALLTSFIPSMHMAGLENVSFGGQDLQIKTDTGNALFSRAITVNFQYETSAPHVWGDPLFKSITAKGKPIN